MAFDEQVVSEQLEAEGEPGQLVADLGCGTGRALVALARRGFRGLGIDLSEKMLEQVDDKARRESLPIETRHGNWVELDGVADESVDHCVSLFSTLGMIHSAAHRRAAGSAECGQVRPGGLFVLHVHNFWFNLYDPGGPWWMVKNVARAAIRRDIEAGDKHFPYRGLPSMYLHVFRRGEIADTLRRAGFRVEQIIPLDTRRHRPLRMPWLLTQLRANGWIVVGRKKAR